MLNSMKDMFSFNYLGIANKMIDIELRPFHGLNVKAIFLHNILCDLCLGYEMTDVIASFDNHIRRTYAVQPAYGTLNFPQFSRFLEKCGVGSSVIMTAINKKGFYMNPGLLEYENELRQTGHTILAMATLASGSLKPQEAYEYLAQIGVSNVVVGLSSQDHATETFNAIKSYIGN